MRRRVDRVEFLDLMTVRRTIVLTLDLGVLAKALPRSECSVIPLGWFIPWANAGAVLRDAEEHVVPCLTSEESDLLVQPRIEDRLRAVGITDDDPVGLVDTIRLHRKDAGLPGSGCTSCMEPKCPLGEAELMNDKWGCRATLLLLEKLRRSNTGEDRELARILLAWQTNFVLFARLDAYGATDRWATLKLSFDEELREWEPPWERRKHVLEHAELAQTEARGQENAPKPLKLSRTESGRYRKRISRGGPFNEDLEKLFPPYPGRALAGRKSLWLRKVGRRGMLGMAWHVAWLQASGTDAANHQVDVILPSELIAVRMRMLRVREEKRAANVADQVGARATIVAPEIEDEARDDRRVPPPTLFSLVITQRSRASWYGGAWIAALTAIAILATALWWLPQAEGEPTDVITILLLAPTLVATLLSVRAGSDIAEQLTKTLRRLIGAVGVLAAVCAIGLVAQGPNSGRHHVPPSELKCLWVGVAILLLLITATLVFGADRIRRLTTFGRALRPRNIKDPCAGAVLNPKGAPRIPPPDCWLAADEGELVPWGWLDVSPYESGSPPPSCSDRCFWQGSPDRSLVDWVRDDVTGFGEGAPSSKASSRVPRLETGPIQRIQTIGELEELVETCKAVAGAMSTFAAGYAEDGVVERLTANVQVIESSRDTLEPSNLQATVQGLGRLASDLLQERKALRARADAIVRECERVETLADRYRDRLAINA